MAPASSKIFATTKFFPLSVSDRHFFVAEELSAQNFADVSSHRINLVFGKCPTETWHICTVFTRDMCSPDLSVAP